jgi:hypothetical protein
VVLGIGDPGTACNPDRRQLGGSRFDRDVGELVVAPIEAGVVGGEEELDRLQDLVGSLASLAHVRAGGSELRRVPARTNAKLEPAAGQTIDGRYVFGERDGMPEGKDQDARADPDVGSDRRRIRQHAHGLEPRHPI